MNLQDDKAEDADLRIQRILGQLNALQHQPEICREDRHHFRLGPQLSEQKLLAFESQVGVRLPEEFRRFCLKAGDGGAGPSYGLLPFAKWSERAMRCEEYYKCKYLARTCPMWPGMPECVGDILSSGDVWDRFCEGTITIVDRGCSQSVVLIVTGKHRGRIVYIDEEVNGAPYMTTDEDFLAWYERWLNAVGRGWDVRCFGPGLKGDEYRMLEVLSDPGSSILEREEALNTMVCMPNLIDGLETCIGEALECFAVCVQIAALRVVEKHRLTSSSALLFSLSESQHDDVRRMVAFAIRSAKPPGWQRVLLKLLSDDEHEVMFPALCGLLDDRSLQRSDLRPLIVSAAPERRSSGLYAWGKMGFDYRGENWVEDRMADPDERVRCQLVMSAEQATWDTLQPMLRQMLATKR